jgi:D-alanyl-D-alanine dipeptidase
MRLAAFLFFVLFAAPAPAQERPAAFVDAASLVPGLVVYMRYGTADNFVGARVDGYEANVCLLTRPAAEALAGVQQDLKAQGLGLKVYDCYRPQRAVAHFVRWAADLKDQSTKARFYPDVDKSRLFDEGYIARRSGHSRGSTLDLTLVDRKGRELDMGGEHDLLSPRSWPSDASVSPEARANRQRLAEAMQRRGFAPYDKEWWHFTLKGEPFPDTYFDFPVR